MIPVLTHHPEGARYDAPLICLSGLWAPASSWAAFGSFLAHRGWAVSVPDLVSLRGGMDSRVDAVEQLLDAMGGAAPVVVTHDAGLLVGLGVAERRRIRALVLLAPLLPGTDHTHALVWSWGLVWRLLSRRAVPPPSGPAAGVLFDAPTERSVDGLRPEDPRVVARMLRAARLPDRPAGLAGVPVLVIRGLRDGALTEADAARVAVGLGGALEPLADAGHWLLGPEVWRRCAGLVHRWVVRSLGESLLELHAEAMAERDGSED